MDAPPKLIKSAELRSQQFINAVHWLEFMQDINSYTQLANKLKVSPATVSQAMKGKAVSERTAALLEEKLLKRHNLNLEAFNKPYLLKLGQEALDTNEEVASLLGTKIIAIEAMNKVLLDYIVTVNKKVGELHKALIMRKTKKTGK